MANRELNEVIDEVELEAKRFLKKIELYRYRLSKNDSRYVTKEGASLKRSALDLKQELTKITQSTVY